MKRGKLAVKRLACLTVLLFCLFVAVACTTPENNEALLELNDNSSFGGLMLGMTVDGMQEKLGNPDAANPTNSGTEYAYHTLDLSVGVDDEQRIRRLSSKNADFNIFAIAVGDELEAAGNILLDNGYTRDAASGWRYNKNEVQIIMLTIDNQKIIGFSAEWLDN